MNTVLDQIGLIAGTEEDGIISPKDNASGRILSTWVMTGVPGIRGTIEGDAVVDKRSIILPDEPLFGLALLDHFEEIGWTVWADGELLNNVFCPNGPGGGVDPHCSPGKENALGREGTHQFPTGLEGLKTVGPAGGSTGAMIMEGENGQRYLLKRGKNEGHLRSESIAGRAYEAAEIGVPEHKVYETETGPVKLSIWAEGTPLKDLSGKDRQEAIEKIKKGFAVDVALANWDVVGLYSDNILVTPKGNVLRIDNGGALEYRAGGKLKGSAWNKDATEFETLRNTPQNSSAVEVFGKMTKKEINDSVEHLVAHTPKILAALPEHLRDTVQARIISIVKQNHELQTKPTVPPKPVDQKPVTPPKPVDQEHVAVLHPIATPPSSTLLSKEVGQVAEHKGYVLAKGLHEQSLNLKLTDLHVKKIAFLNPDWKEGDAFNLPIIGRTASAPSHIAAREHFAKLLPPGTVIKNKVISAKDAENFTPLKSFDVTMSPTTVGMPFHAPYHTGEIHKGVNTKDHFASVKLTHDEIGALSSYKGSSYSGLNAAMRDCPPKFDCLSGDHATLAKHIGSALAKAPIFSEHIPVTRRISVTEEKRAELKEKFSQALTGKGMLVSMPSYVSTSKDEEPPFGGNIFFHILAKTGLHIISISPIQSSENEFLQSPHAKFETTKIKESGSTLHIYLKEHV